MNGIRPAASDLATCGPPGKNFGHWPRPGGNLPWSYTWNCKEKKGMREGWKKCHNFTFIKKGSVTFKHVAPSHVIWNKFHASHWLSGKKEGKSSNGRHETYFKWHLIARHISLQMNLKDDMSQQKIKYKKTMAFTIFSSIWASKEEWNTFLTFRLVVKFLWAFVQRTHL